MFRLVSSLPRNNKIKYSWFSHNPKRSQKTIDIAAMLVSQTKDIIKILLLRVSQHGENHPLHKHINAWAEELGIISNFMCSVIDK